MDYPNFISKLRDNVLTCSICGERYNDPKTLKCEHTFCAKCIEKHHEENSEGNEALCPLCREPFVFCQAGSSFLRPSLPIVQLLDLFKPNERKSTTLALHVCQISYHCKSDAATSFCPRCNKCMCDKCAEAHSHLLRDHEVNPLTNFQNFDLTDDFKCPKHDKKPYLRCISCDTIMCDVCKSKHDETHILKSVDQMKSEVREIRKLVIITKHHLEDEKDEYRRTDTMMRMSEGKARHTLSKSYKEAKEGLEKNKTKLDSEIQKHSADLQKTVVVKIKDTESRLNKASKLIDLIDRLFSAGSERHLLEYWPDIQNHLNAMPVYESKEHEPAAKYDDLEKFGIEFKPIEGLQLGSITKTKAYEDWFGNFKQKDEATKSTTELVSKETTSHPEDQVTNDAETPAELMKETPSHQVKHVTTGEHVGVNQENSGISVYSYAMGFPQSCRDERNQEEEYARHIRKMSPIVQGSKTEEGKTGPVLNDNIRRTTGTDKHVVEEKLFEGNTLFRLNAAISGAVVFRNAFLFLVSFKSDKMFVIDIEKCQITVDRETVKPFDVAATRDGALGVGEVLLVTCHKGRRSRCRIEKYRDGGLDGIFTKNVSFPCGITILNDNDVCVCESNPDKNLSQLKIFDIKGNLKKEIKRSIFKCPSYLTGTPENELLVSDIEANCVWCLKNCEIGYPTVVYGESDIEPRKATIFNNYIFVTGKRTEKSRVFDQQGQQIYEVRIKNETGFFNPAVLADSGRSLICISETGIVVNVLPREYESMFMTKL